MNYFFRKSGGLVVNFNKYSYYIFPANTRFAKSKGVIVLFGIGFSYSKKS